MLYIASHRFTFMPLSKHFYSLDEVQAALFYTAGRYDAKEALFWCKEMIDSGCIGEAISTLFESWLWHKGPFCIAWLVQAWTTLRSEELTEEAILLSVYQLCSCKKKDNSLWNILALGSQSVDRVTPKTPPLPYPDDEMCPKELYFLRALHQGKARSAWFIANYLEPARVWWLVEWYHTHVYPYTECRDANRLEALKGYEDLLGYRSDAYDTIIRCCAILSVCTSSPKQHMAPGMDERMNTAIEEWKKLDGRQSRRIYTIPSACLYGRTQRSHMKWSQPNLVQLYQVEMYLVGCPFWEDVLSHHATIINEKIQWVSEKERETFYQTYFPDDIPDEWSLAEKKKSHGDGVLGLTDKVTLVRYARTHFSGLSRLAWNTTKEALLQVEKRDNQDCEISSIADTPLFPFDDAFLKPVHKRPKV